MDAHHYLQSKVVREKGAAIKRAVYPSGEKAFDEKLIDANDRACSYLDSYQKAAWDHFLDGFTSEDVARIMNMSESEVEHIIELTRSRICGLL